MERIARVKQYISKLLTTIIKVIVVAFFSITLFDKINITSVIRDFILNMDFDRLYNISYYIYIAIKSLLWVIPLLVGVTIMLIEVFFAFVCINILLYLILSRFFTNSKVDNKQTTIQVKNIEIYNNFYSRNNRIRC